jgi:hypothetical protein
MTDRSEYQASFSREELPLVVGSEYAIRYMYHGWDGLRGAHGQPWKDGENVARHVSYHTVQECAETFLDCVCGFYGAWTYISACTSTSGFKTIKETRDEFSAINPVMWDSYVRMLNDFYVAAIVEHYGETVIGESGVRSKKARLRKVLVNANKLQDTVVITSDDRQVVTIYSNRLTRIRELYPSSEVVLVGQLGPNAWMQAVDALEDELAQLRNNNQQGA